MLAGCLHEQVMEIWLGTSITDALLDQWRGLPVHRVKEKSETILREVTGKNHVFI